MSDRMTHRSQLVRLAALSAVLLCIVPVNLMAGQALAPELNTEPRTIEFTEMFTFLFLMLGPIKILGPFVKLTRGGDETFARKLAVRGFIFSCVALVFAAIIGEKSMRKYHVSVPVLAIAAGIILFLVALQTVMQQFDSDKPAHREFEPSLRLAVSPLAFPTIVTPYGVAAVIIFMTITPDFATRSEIFGVLLGLMVLNLIAMLFANPILKYAGMPLQLLGTVLGIIQVALGLQIMVLGLRGLGILAKR